jgi:hypothetical protein
MFPAFARKEMLSALWIKQGLTPNTLADGSTINTYDASPQPAAGIDSWDSGTLLFENLLVVVDVSAVSGTGTLTVTLRDCKTALTAANGDANSVLAATLTEISAVGIYTAEFRFTHVFPSTATTRRTDDDFASIMRYHSLRAVADGCNFTFGAICIYGNNTKGFPTQDATALTVTWTTS